MSQPVPTPAAPPVMRQIPRRYVALGLIVVAILLLGALVVIRDDRTPASLSTVETFNPAPASLITSVGHIPDAVIDAVGVASTTNPITPLSATGNPSLWQVTTHGVEALPVVFFYGAEFAPYAAAERWPLVVALSCFGTFSQLGLAQSSTSVAFSDLSTFTFWHDHYTSRWLSLQTVERYSSQNPTGARYTTLQTPNARETASIAAYDTSSSTFPLLDVANRYILVGSSFSPAIFDGLSQAGIVADLGLATSPVTQAVIASANEITATICTVTGERPGPVCSAHGVVEAAEKLGIPAGAAG